MTVRGFLIRIVRRRNRNIGVPEKLRRCKDAVAGRQDGARFLS